MWQLILPFLQGVFNRLVPDPVERARVEKEMAELAIRVSEAEAEREARLIESVNATMREEAKSEHWAQWLWRPMIGFTLAAVIINNYILMPYFQHSLKSISIPSEVWSAMLVILGAAAATRGWKQIEEARKNGNGNGAPVLVVPKKKPNPTVPDKPQPNEK